MSHLMLGSHFNRTLQAIQLTSPFDLQIASELVWSSQILLPTNTPTEGDHLNILYI